MCIDLNQAMVALTQRCFGQNHVSAKNVTRKWVNVEFTDCTKYR